MNKKIEEEIIRTFVKRNKQDRILWELSSQKYRENVVFRKMSVIENFKKECIYPMDFPTKKFLEKYLLTLGGKSEAYFLGDEHIGECTITEGWKYMDEREIGILYCGNGIGYYLEEPMPFKMQGYLLLRQDVKYIEPR